MTKTILFLFISFGFSVSLNAQANLEWTATYMGPLAGGNAYLLQIDGDSNIYVSGQIIASGSRNDVATIKYNSKGDSLWTRLYSGWPTGTTTAEGLAVDKDGNVYISGSVVTGAVGGGANINCVTVKYSREGELLWEKQHDESPDDRSVGVGIDDSGYVYIAGVRNQTGGSGWGIIAVKYDPLTGDTIWTASYDHSSTSIDIANAMTVDGAGNVYVCGYSNSDSIRSLVLKFNSNGQLEWASLYKTPGISGSLAGNAVKVHEGNVYITGQCYNGPATFVDFLTIKYFSNGDTAWVRKYSNSTSSDIAQDLVIDNSGNVCVTGASRITGQGGSNNWDYLTVKYDNSGNFLWQSTYNGPAGPTQDEARAIALDRDNNVYVTGGSSVSPLFYNAEFATVKYDVDGNQEWVERYSSYFGGYAIALDDNFNVYVTGSTSGVSYRVLKYNQGMVSTGDPSSEMPLRYSLSQNYPNPFNPVTRIDFTIPEKGFVKLHVYNMLGREITTLVNEVLDAGAHSYEFNGSALPSGVYFYKLVVNPGNSTEIKKFTPVKKMILLK
jgi:hypothetical protein